MVQYEGLVYPGVVVVDEDAEEVEVKCMHRIGNNRFLWPAREDVCWYAIDGIIIDDIPPPQKVTGSGGHFKVDENVWANLN